MPASTVKLGTKRVPSDKVTPIRLKKDHSNENALAEISSAIREASEAKRKSKTRNHNAIVVMRHVKTTKNTHVYELDEGLTEDGKPICKSVYLMKDALPDPPPDVIQQTISYEA